MRDVQRCALVDDAFEHRLGEDPHGGSMTPVPRESKPDDEQMLADFGAALADAIEAALPGWIERCVSGRLTAWSGTADPAVLEQARAAGAQAGAEVGKEVRAPLALDVDEQRPNPLSLIRLAVRYPTDVLRSAGVPPVRRDEFAEQAFPDDIYDLSPASFADVDQSL